MKYEIEKWFNFINWKPTEESLQNALLFFSNERQDVRSRFEKLSYYATDEEQEQAIHYLAVELLPDEYIYLIMAGDFSLTPYNDLNKYYTSNGGKERWENAAKVIIRIGWPKVDNIIIPLFIWLLDPNWPGSSLIYHFLLSLPRNILHDKMKEIINHPQNYDKTTYEDLKLQIGDLCDELNIVL